MVCTIVQIVFIPVVRTQVLRVFSRGNKNVCSTELIQAGSLAQQILKLTCALLHDKQKQILCKLIESAEQPVTRIIPSLANNLECSASTVWMHLRILRTHNLISFSSTQDKGVPCFLTILGKTIAQIVRGEEDVF
ncbi:MAG: ArsR family transcriptional regulator [Candidatus Woesearchaeota archaeon]|nr:ArsR family transcriptional regulator [Candidatus Woesearchaeota archaeon]